MTLAPEMAKEYSELFDTEAVDIQSANAQFDTGSSVRTLISYAVGVTLYESLPDLAFTTF
jgi:lipoprotein-releasing system permease protein